MKGMRVGALIGLVATSVACATPVMTWVPVVGAAGLILKARQPSTKSAAAPAGAARTSLVDFERLYAEGTVLVIDVRAESSFKAGHIPGALNVPVDEIGTRADEILTRAGSHAIVTYCSCASEHASAIAAQALTQAGACRVSALVGGYPAWVAGGRQVEHN